MGHHHVGAFLLGLEGAALLRANATGATPEAFAERFDEIGGLLDAIRGGLLDIAWESAPVTTTAGYAAWSSSYDGPNPLIDVEQPIVRQLLADLAPGIALDAACGTGRHAHYLAAAGHDVIGIDESPDMLATARNAVPTASFTQADLRRLPLDDGSVDLAVCALALTHIADLGVALSELARVLRPGGVLVTSDIHWVSLFLGGVPQLRLPDGTTGRLPAFRHTAADYLAAALSAGLVVEACYEPTWPDVEGGHGGELAQRWCPTAAQEAYVGTPATIIWKLRLPA